jgi:hypothetical protein
MSYGYGNGGGGYQRQGGYNNQGGGYQQRTQQAPPPPPLNIDEEIDKRLDMFQHITDRIKARGLEPTDFTFALGGWVTSLILEQKKR